MSDSKNTDQPTVVYVKGLNTSIQTFNPKKFKVDQTIKYCTPVITSDVSATPATDFTGVPVPKELKFMREEFLRSAKTKLAGSGFKILATASKMEFLVDPADHKNTVAVTKFDTKECRIKMVVFEGDGKPYDPMPSPDFVGADHVSEWKKIHLPSGHASKRYVRFARVEVWDDTAYDELEKDYANFQTRLADDRKADFRFYQTKIKIRSENIILKDVVKLSLTAGNFFTANNARELIKAFMYAEYKGNGELVVHGDKFFDKSDMDATHLGGFHLVNGEARNLYINEADQVMLATRPVQKYFFPDGKVSSFMINRKTFAKTKGVLPDIADAKEVLRGKLVTHAGQDGDSKTAIANVEWELPDPKKVSAIYPTLPYLKLAGPKEDEYNPLQLPENCNLIAMQSVRKRLEPEIPTKAKAKPAGGEATQGDTTQGEALQGPNAIRLSGRPGDKMTIEPYYIHHKVTEMATPLLNGHYKRILHLQKKKPIMIFVNVTTENEDTSVPKWLTLQQELKSNSHVRTPKELETEPLTLEYKKEGDALKDWPSLLKQHVLEQKAMYPDNRAFLVASLPNEDNQAIYKIVKNICETEVGIQSFFVNLGNPNPKKSQEPTRAAGNVLRRMRVRNPPVMYTIAKKSGSQDLAVSIHIAPIMKEGDGLFLHTVVARDMGTSNEYHTDVSLVKKDHPKITDPMSHITEFVKKFPKVQQSPDHRVTVFRSGYFPFDKSVEQGDNKLRLNVKQVNLVTGKLEDAEARAKLAKVARKEAGQNEFAKLSHNIKGLSKEIGEVQVSYVLLQEEAAMGTSEKEAKANAKVVTDALGELQKPIVFARTEEEKKTVYHMDRGSANKKCVSLTVLSEKDGLEKNLDRLGSAFCDDYLGLYDTKWPITTHLAHLATVRAELRVHEAGPGAPEKYELQDVADDVKNSLYFL